MSTWKIIVWLLSTLGIAGTIALFVLFPTIVSAIFRGVVKLIQTELSYRIGCAITAAIITGFAVDYWRHSRDDAAFAVRTAQFEQAQVDRDKKIADDTRAAVETEIADQKTKDSQTDIQVKDFHDALPPIPTADACGDIVRVGDNAERLRAISGQAGRRSVGAQRVPKARKKAAHS